MWKILFIYLYLLLTYASACCVQGKKSFNIFDAGSVSDVKKTLKKNIESATAQQGDPAERVTSIGKPGETQEVWVIKGVPLSVCICA